MRSTSPAIQPRPVGHLVFAAALGQQLHADADAEERPAFLMHRFVKRLDHAVDGIEPAAAIGERADAGQHDAIGRGNDVRIVGHDDRLADAGIMRRALERFGGRMQIAGAIIDDGDGHRDAPGSGNRPTMSGACGIGGGAGGAGGEAGGVGPLVRARHSAQASKNRRSAASALLPPTTPTCR